LAIERSHLERVASAVADELTSDLAPALQIHVGLGRRPRLVGLCRFVRCAAERLLGAKGHAGGEMVQGRSQPPCDRLINAISPLPDVSGVRSPLSASADRQISADRKIAYAQVQFDEQSDKMPAASINRVIATAQRFAAPGFRVELGGEPISSVSNTSPGSSEAIGILAAIIIMLVAFGSVIAMGLPILTALLGIGVGVGLVDLLSRLLTVPTFGPELMAMIGLGVGIDYSLFVVTRYRDGLHHGMTPRDATITALQTSGRAVAFAGGTVVISLLGLFVIDQSFMDGMALASIFAVIAVLLGTLTLLPATFAFTGHNIDGFGISGLRRRKRTAITASRTAHEGRHGFWYGWSRAVQRRPLPFGVAAVILVGVLAIPFFSMRLAFTDSGNDPSGSTTRQAFGLLAQGFGPGFSGPLVVAVKLPGKSAVPVIDALRNQIGRTPGVAAVAPARSTPTPTRR
jgi:RND superfamily putative drug exporter